MPVAGAKITAPIAVATPGTSAQTLGGNFFYFLSDRTPVWKPQGHCVSVFFVLLKSAVQFNYFHAQIVAGLELLVNLPINITLCHA